jgi:hypothetical protein
MRLADKARWWDKKVFVSAGSQSGITLQTFLNSFRKGSGPFRRYLNDAKKAAAQKTGTKCLNNFFIAAGLNPIPIADFSGYEQSKILDCWNNSFITNRQRDFMYKYTSNRLSVNARLAHYIDNINAGCTYCTVQGALPAPSESFRHLFFDCPFTGDIQKKFEEKLIPEINLADDDREKLWLTWNTGTIAGTGKYNLFLQLAVSTVQFYIWECKIKKTKLSWSSCETFVLQTMKDMCTVSNVLNGYRHKIDISLSRRW